MRWSKTYIPTLREAPADADVISNKLLIKAGLIRKLTAGIFTWLPLGLLSLYRCSEIVRREMNKAGAVEVLMSMVNPGNLWEETGRWKKYGKELLRFKDRHERDYCLGPTHEEVITDLLRGEVRSYRQMPINLYQIQTKFRDEIRPRFGLMRGREFLMKDAYSFDRNDEGANASYVAMRDAYNAVYSNMCLDYRMVEADSGAIGGNYSHEFMVLAESGEDVIASCPSCKWGANVERAPLRAAIEQDKTPCPPLEWVATPNEHSVDSLCEFFHITADKCLKTLLFVADGKGVAVMLRGDHELNDVKFKNLLGVDDLEFASPEQVSEWTGADVGFAGPVGLKHVDKIYADNALKGGNDWVAGMNKSGHHALHLSVPRDATLPVVWADLRNIVAGDPCPECGKPVQLHRGIEVGHIFKLGTKYSEAMHANFLDEDGVEKPIVMGCYGIGVSRLIAASIEQNYDEKGIKFPPPLAPYDVHIINIDPKDPATQAKADELDAFVNAQGLTTLYDDREERPGVKFNDADLLGLPLQIIVGGKSLAEGKIETKNRRTGEKGILPVTNYAEAFKACHKSVLDSWAQ